MAKEEIFGSGEIEPVVFERLFIIFEDEEVMKNKNFYEETIPMFSLSTFKSHFKMSPTVFEHILGKISPSPHFHKRRVELGGREQVNVEKTLLITLWTLATPESYRSIGDRFNVTKYTVWKCLHTTVTVILSDLCQLYIKWPSLEERPFVADVFNKYVLQHVLGAIDGCHIPIKRPHNHPLDYFNRKQFYSVVSQAVCKYNLEFSDIDIRWPGGVHDARVLRTSDIYPIGPQLCQHNYYLVGDSAYPNLHWIIGPFKNNGHLTPAQIHFNKKLSKTRVRIEHAFGLLKGRFRRLKELLDMEKHQDIVNTIGACCILHNICIHHGDGEDIQDYINEGMPDINLINIGVRLANQDEDEGTIRRNNIVQDLWAHRPQRF